MATTNESKYLHDSSGGRRFWPVTIKRLDAEALTRDRDQLWAEALELYRAGERWWPSGERECETLANVVEERYAQDPWEAALAKFMTETTEPQTVEQLLRGPLRVDVERQDRAAATRVGTIMSRLGYAARRAVVGGVKVRLFDSKKGNSPCSETRQETESI
jgi:putative DNA primase/helicase